MRKLILPILFVVLISGCISADMIPLNPAERSEISYRMTEDEMIFYFHDSPGTLISRAAGHNTGTISMTSHFMENVVDAGWTAQSLKAKYPYYRPDLSNARMTGCNVDYPFTSADIVSGDTTINLQVKWNRYDDYGTPSCPDDIMFMNGQITFLTEPYIPPEPPPEPIQDGDNDSDDFITKLINQILNLIRSLIYV